MRASYVFILLSILLTACSTPGVRQNNANRLAYPVFMIPRMLTIDGYQLKLYERVHDKGAIATVYIEGSGEVWYDGFNPMHDPTPENPVALALAAQDTGKNVIYIGRTCQYGMKKVGVDDCPQSTLRNKMFAPDMVALYGHVLDEVQKRYRVQKFHVVGFESGGGLATILAANRSDVLSLRTVAGVLDTDMFAKSQNIQWIEASQNPVSVVPQLISMPQHHYIAQLDDLVPNDVYHSFAQAFGDNRCLAYTLVQNTDHTYDWSENWTAFAREPVTCINGPAGASGARFQQYTPTIDDQ
jgi:hypothetical protein